MEIRIVLILLFCIFSTRMTAQENGRNQDHKNEIIYEDIKICELGERVFDQNKVDDYRLILLGEELNHKKNEEILISLFEHNLNLDSNYSLILEIPYSVEYLFNYWVTTGREIYFDGKKNALEEYDKNKYQKLLKELYRLKIENTRNFKLKGIDLEKDLIFSLSLINIFLANNEDNLSDSLKYYHKSIDSLIGYIDPHFELKDITIGLYNHYKKNKALVLSSLGSYLEAFDKILIGTIKGIECYDIGKKQGDILAGNFREKVLFDNLENVLNSNPTERFICQLGSFHFLQDSLMKTINYNGNNLNQYATISKFLSMSEMSYYSILLWYQKGSNFFLDKLENDKLRLHSNSMKGKLGYINIAKMKNEFHILNTSFDSVIISKY